MNNKNKIISLSIALLANFQMNSLTAQSLSPQVIASAGGYQSSSIGSLSFTIGETNSQTLSSSTHILTQGFQQPYKMTLNVKAYIEGYYKTAGMMENVLYTQGIISLPNNQCDSIQIQLRQSNAPYNIISTSNEVIQTNGMVTFSGTAPIGQTYYIVIKHRNAIETWSANPILLTDNTSYDFTTAANQAFGSNQLQVETGVWALYSGDLNIDENIDLLDLGLIEADISNFIFGYFATDINGDGNVDLLDAAPVETNVNGFVFSSHP